MTGLERVAGSALFEQGLAFFDIAGSSARGANERQATHHSGRDFHLMLPLTGSIQPMTIAGKVLRHADNYRRRLGGVRAERPLRPFLRSIPS